MPGILPLDLTVPPGHEVGSYEEYDPSENGYIGWVWDFTTNELASWAFNNGSAPISDYYNGDAADAIVERPGPASGGGPTNLSNFGQLSFITSAGDDVTLDTFISGSLNHITMYSGSTEPFPYIGPAGTGTGNQMTSMDQIGSQGSFSVQQMHCQ